MVGTSNRNKISTASRRELARHSFLIQLMSSVINWTFSSISVACLFVSLVLFNRMRKFKIEIEEKKFDIQTAEENLWQLNNDLSQSILTKLRLVDRLSSSQV